MRKFITAIMAGLMLVAGQAAATANQPVDIRVGDRVGARADASSDDLRGGFIIPMVALVALVLVVVVATRDDDSESD